MSMRMPRLSRLRRRVADVRTEKVIKKTNQGRVLDFVLHLEARSKDVSQDSRT